MALRSPERSADLGGGRLRHLVLSVVVAAIVWILALPSADAQQTGRRLALVAGNSDYNHVVELPNPRRDARAVGAKLESMGFEVVTLLDLDADSMEQAIRDFARQSRDADIALFYYAGHGVQVDGRNYLLPVDADILLPRDLLYEAISLDLITSELDRSGARLSLVLLDACRDNPLEELFRRQSGGVSRSIETGSGLAQTQGAAGMLIAYATAPDTVALDGLGNHSPFTQALLEWVDLPGLEVGRLFRRVRERVIEITKGQQVPWVEEAVIGEFYLNQRAPETAAGSSDPEGVFWDHVQTIDNAAERLVALQRYMLVFPEGERIEEARRMRRSLMQSGAVAETDLNAAPGAGQGLTLLPVEQGRQTAALDPRENAAQSAVRSETGGDPALLCVRNAGDPLVSAGAPGRWVEDRRFPLSPSLHRLDSEQAIHHCQEAVQQAKDNIALEGLLGRSLEAAGEWAEALRYLRPAADAGDPVATYTLATMFRDGRRVPPDAVRAQRLFEKAANAGHLGAAFELGLAYRDGLGVPEDAYEAATWLQQAAVGGYDWAQYELGDLIIRGRIGPSDPSAALDWWRRAAGQGNSHAAASAGELLMRGEGVTADTEEASRWLRLAVIQGHEDAERPLAELLLTTGEGVEAEAEAAKLLERSARRRDSQAALLLGELHATGQSSLADPALAAYWLAAAHGAKDVNAGAAAAAFADLPRGAVVEALQQALVDLGYDPGIVDGAMGERTMAAIRQFQNDHGGAADITAGVSIELLARLIESGQG